MPSLLSNRLAKRMLRPAFSLVEQRLERATTALQADLDALHHEVADLRRQSYGLGLLLDHAGRDGHRMATATQLDTLVREVTTVTGASGEHARRDLTVAYRTVVALEALGVGRMAGSTSDICGKLATVPLLAPPNEEVLEIGTQHGLFAAALLRMLHRAGVEPRLTVVDPLAGALVPSGTAPAPVREDVVRANLALCGSRSGAQTRLLRGESGDTGVRAEVSDRRYGVVVLAGDPSVAGVLADLRLAEELAAEGAVVVLDGHGDDTRPGVGEALAKRVADGSRLRILGVVAGTAFLRAE
ncbi:class I SAM-dependent methyltransferase [Streptomyces tirandamycinicus]|uniref:class I SAM-dependent methyltransferase n=1 Tax=Streptomyces tirandamycinicus TaxID=2174846 RepID=UPI00226DB771|nr:class I SAM-dependent methyltransferase [Streptomyces tirandamycinicus]MCY0984629.1 class I SAM-dependent methyltransferase [Streptomyces tirandamycinicus]